jgi:hypothetical protein
MTVRLLNTPMCGPSVLGGVGCQGRAALVVQAAGLGVLSGGPPESRISNYLKTKYIYIQ